ncbi:MAG: Trm112 family protein [Xanthomonadaceae bacterium]|jgi:uncharacterized protein YbaR (Trm112 family)|nr:Trm112 family protein [Xanthomonadaceae bacterium]
MDRKLLEMLRSPETRQPLALLKSSELESLNQAIAGGGVVRADGTPQQQPLRQALITADRAEIYRIDDGIPVLLAEEAIDTRRVPGFAP